MTKPPTPASDIYRTAILAEVPRVLGLMDREPFSPTQGCCDRVYWAWKFTDFPGARFQEALCVLGFLYATDFDGNDYHGNPKLLEWIGGGLAYWSSIQYPDGSFDEAYPFERSLAATAFTAFYVGEALTFLGDALPADTRARTLETLRKAGTWLCNNDETHGFLSNHLAAAAAALHHVYRLTGDEVFANRSQYFIERILSHQSTEGWYDEYGSADPGYQDHGSFYLARIWQFNNNAALADSLDRAMQFLAHFVHVDGSLGGEYASRNTQTYYPAAFEMFAHGSTASAWIADFKRPSVLSGAAADLRGVDAYNYFPFLNNMVFAWLACRENEQQPAPAMQEPDSTAPLVWYPQAGLARVRRKNYDAFIGTAKGGVLKLFDRRSGRMVYSDCGYIGKLHSGRVFSSQHQDPQREVHVDANRIEIGGNFSEISRPVMKPLRFIGFRCFMLSVGRFPALARWLKQYLVKVLIYRKRTLAIDFSRTIRLDEQAVTIQDRIAGSDGNRVARLQRSDRFTTIHMGSSRYFINNELNDAAAPDSDVISPAQITSGVSLEHVIAFEPAVREESQADG
jgi:hypothetical protein